MFRSNKSRSRVPFQKAIFGLLLILALTTNNLLPVSARSNVKDGDTTNVQLRVPNPNSAVRANDDRLETYEWPTVAPTVGRSGTVTPASIFINFDGLPDGVPPDWHILYAPFSVASQPPAIVKAQVQEGHFLIENQGTFSGLYALYGAIPSSNIQISLDAVPDQGTAIGVFLVCRYSEAGWYQFRVSNGSSQIQYVQPQAQGGASSVIPPGETFNVIPLAEGPGVFLDDGTHRLSGICDQNQLTLLADGTEILSTQADLLPNGTFGFGVESHDQPFNRKAFDNLEIQFFPTFADVPTTYWVWDYIGRLYNSGITSGCSTSPLMYCPENPVTRAQMAVFLERGMNGSAYTPPPATGTVFTDVPITYPNAAWIEKLFADGITSGCSTSPLMYCPEATVTRAQMAVFLLRAEHFDGVIYNPPAATGIFADVPVSDPTAPWIEQLYHEGITGGCSTSPLMYCPGNPVTRASMAVFLVRTFNLP